MSLRDESLLNFFQVLAKDTVPRWDSYRYSAKGLSLTSQPDQWLRLCRFDVAKLLNLLPLAHTYFVEFLSATENPDPAGAAGSGAALHRNWSFNPTRIKLTPVTRTIGFGAPREVLRIVQLIPRCVVVLVVVDCPLLVHRFQET